MKTRLLYHTTVALSTLGMLVTVLAAARKWYHRPSRPSRSDPGLIPV
jgi:hypothetical protein